MTPIAQKTFCLAKRTWLLWIVMRTFLAGMFIMYSGCAHLKPVNLQDEKALAPAKTELWTTLAAERSDNWFKLLNTGDEAIEWRLRVIDSATRSLDLQTFLWKEDPTGLQILRHIFEAADRGVRVRLLLDDTFTVGQNDIIFDIDQHPNIEYRIYNPFERRMTAFFYGN
jgi:putative cardiolipin synthase